MYGHSFKDCWPDWLEEMWDATPKGTNSSWYVDDDYDAFVRRTGPVDAFGGMDDEQIVNLFDELKGHNMINGVTINSATNFDHDKFMADVTHGYIRELSTLGLRDVAKEKIYGILNTGVSFGNAMTYFGSGLALTGVLAEFGLPIMAFGGELSFWSTALIHTANGYYGTFDGQQAIIDVAFYGIGKGFDSVAGYGAYTGYYTLGSMGSQEWLNYINSFK